jgi:peptidoglycan/xylan/chitin deacetylase (PgdA/CDA1 family)
VIITFDDGDESNHRLAFPALAESKSSADFFVTPAQVGTPGYCTWAQLREMSDAGMSIQSHGYTHAHHLTDVSPAQLREELTRARREIEEHVGRPVTLLAPAGGRMPAGLLQTARACGYTHVLSSRPGKVRPNQDEMCRLAVTARLALATLESWLRGGRALLRAQARYAALDFAKRLLGDARYESVRKRLLGTALA